MPYRFGYAMVISALAAGTSCLFFPRPVAVDVALWTFLLAGAAGGLGRGKGFRLRSQVPVVAPVVSVFVYGGSRLIGGELPTGWVIPAAFLTGYYSCAIAQGMSLSISELPLTKAPPY